MTKHTIFAIVRLAFVAVNAVRHAQASSVSYIIVVPVVYYEVADRLSLFTLCSLFSK